MTATEDVAEIGRAIEEFIVAYERGDTEALLRYYTDDLVKLRFQSAPEGKAETGRRLRAFFASHSGRLTVTTDEVLVSGDVAFTRGTLHIEARPHTGGPWLRTERRYVELWRREADGWKVARTMDSAL